ncbi:hypothetical protein FPZ12_006070 [Amycolatopsis acidicola]|uniref:Uncharacterized protein n=1 Tax=Amycolatopsis acidicola TaxID=2596893 RepID=A0A5N0VGZ5_9PSEU|nr:hypothetical protein [Amycolatopsis acidicola]KAA9165627.1 hypothetical protein FPZ12_006070 [Amycolatopsis acidicola]
MDVGGPGAEVIPPLFRGLLDDAAVFPPGSLPLAEAVPAHVRHRAAPYREIVGPLVLAAPDLAGLGDTELELAVTAPGGPAQLPEVFARVAGLPVRLAGLEVAMPAGMSVAEFFGALPETEVPVFVEIPRDERRADVIAACARTGHQAKFRAGGVKAELYPDETELAAGIRAVTGAGVPFKATAGLHHAIRNTDPATGFEQHGYLNILAATADALAGKSSDALADVLAERDGRAIADRLSTVDDGVRAAFRSFGTCSIIEPLTELAELGLVDEGVIA